MKKVKQVDQFHYMKLQPNWKQLLLIDVLAALYLLPGCDMASKICSKNAALKTAETSILENLVAFGKTPINLNIIITAETFFVECIDGKISRESFNKMRTEYYH